VDDLRLLRARLGELIEAKMARITAMRAEIASDEAEIEEARELIRRWDTPRQAPAAPAAPIAVATPIPRPEKKPIRMPRPAVLAYLREHGPRTSKEIIHHFGMTDGRSGSIFSYWVKDGYLLRLSDGRLQAPGVVELSDERRLAR
jgi:hypothetical protein